MSTPEVGAAVIGAGVAGLAAALELQRAGVSDLVLIDASDRPGGVMRTDHMLGYVIERGPNTVQVKAPMLAFLRRCGLEGLLLRARPESRRRCLYQDGRLVAVPSSPFGLLRTSLLSSSGKLRLLAEPFVPRGDGRGESVAEFAARRLGVEVASRLVGPFLTGVYAGDEEELGAESVFPTLVELERSHRSLALGALARRLRGAPRGLPGTFSAGQGLGPFARRLADQLAEPPTLSSRVEMLERDGDLWRLAVAAAGGVHSLSTRRLVLATAAPEAAELLRPLCPEAARTLAEIRYAPIVGVPLGVEPAAVRASIEGFGFLVPRQEGLGLLGCLFMSRLFPARAPEGRELLHCMLGGTRWPEVVALSDAEVVKRTLEDLDRSLGLRADPQVLTVTRWIRAIPQPDRHHASRIESLRGRVREACPGLRLAGGYLDGVAVADALASGVRAAAELAPPG